MMSVTEAMKTRRSIRAFLDKPVPLEMIKDILDTARYSPSGCNFQPWEAAVLTGEPLRALQEKMLAAAPQTPEEYTIVPPDIGEDYMARQREIGAQMYQAVNVDRSDTDARNEISRQNIVSFGAPILLLCYTRRVMGAPQWSDLGMWLQSIMLLVQEAGLDTCPQEYMALYGRLIKEFIHVDDSEYVLFCGIAIGYGDKEAPINNFERSRIPLESHIKFLGFENS